MKPLKILAITMLIMLVSIGARKTQSNSSTECVEYIDDRRVITTSEELFKIIDEQIFKNRKFFKNNSRMKLNKFGESNARVALFLYCRNNEKFGDLNVLPATAITQAMIESGITIDSSMVKKHNYFGVKCGKSWNGKTTYAKDDEYVNGKLVPSCFRTYEKRFDSWLDYSKKIIAKKRYDGARDCEDTLCQLYEIRKAAYATLDEEKYMVRHKSVYDMYNVERFNAIGKYIKSNFIIEL